MASPTRKELISKVQKIIPPMLESFHKGQLGRVAVIGGSEDYTGAPYFSAMASARLGCDLSHVICEPGAGTVIKSYSPNIMVHPYMRQAHNLSSSTKNDEHTVESLASPILALLSRLHVLVIGPGLGRDSLMQSICAKVVAAAREQNIPVVLDADGLQLAQKHPELVQGWRGVVLTPNVVEFARLAESKGIDVKGEEETLCAKLAEAFGGVTIIRKGSKDYISNGSHTLMSDGVGGLKRSGGQGDTLTGSVATLLAWRKAYHDGLWDHASEEEGGNKKGEEKMSEAETLALAAWAGSAITRECSRLAFAEFGRSLQAGDLTVKVHQSFLNIFGEKTKL
jgi:ATP-dependent NAD(P)H-hydrate dehydratase